MTAFYGAQAHALHDGCDCGDCRFERGMQKAPFSDWQPVQSERQSVGETKLWRELAAALRTLKDETYKLVTGAHRKAVETPVEWTAQEQYHFQQALNQYMTETVGAPQPDFELWRSDPSSILPANLSLQFAAGVEHAAEDLIGGAAQVIANRRAFLVEKFLRTSFNRLSARGWGALKDVIYRGSIDDVPAWLADKANVQPPGVEVILRHGIANGRGSIAVARDLSRAYTEYERWEFERLARTETAFALNAGTQAELEAQGYVRLEGTPDVPLHPSCRCGWTINNETGEIIYLVSITACVACRELLVLEDLARQRRPQRIPQ